jgi:hypothetical protein
MAVNEFATPRHRRRGGIWRDPDVSRVGDRFRGSLSQKISNGVGTTMARTIADLSVTVLDEVGLGALSESYLDRLATIPGLPAADRGWLATLFADRIILSEQEYTNGQHRACALHFSGAEMAVVVTGDSYLGDEPADWTYEGEG